MSSIRSRQGRLVFAALASVSLLAASGPAQAGGETLKRSVGNIVQAPIDLALSPITAGIVEYRNLSNVDDSMPVRVVYAIPGYLWLTGLHAGASVLREVAGLLELLPGLVMLPTDNEMDPLFDPVEKGNALFVDTTTPVMDINIGIDYTAAP